MWKIVKSELKYMGTELMRCWCYYLIGITILLVLTYIGFDRQIGRTLAKPVLVSHYFLFLIRHLWSLFPLVFVVLQIHLLIREVTESKLGCFITLPVNLKSVAYSRILTPFLTLCIGTILYYSVGHIHNFLIPDAVESQYNSRWEGDLLTINTSIMNPQLWFLFPFTFGLRLLLEGKRKMIGISLFIAWFYYFYLSAAHNNIQYSYTIIIGLTWTPAVAILLCIAFSTSIYCATMQRKSYMR